MTDTRVLNFLIVDDEVEIADIISLFIANHYKANFTMAESGSAAVEILQKKDQHFDMVISDFNMANGNGFVAYEGLRKLYPQCPFLLITSDTWTEHPEFHGTEINGYVSKPFSDDAIVQEIERLLSVKAPVPKDDHRYVAVSLGTMGNIKDITHNIYVKINDDKFVRILNAGATITADDLVKYKHKGIQYLYVEREHFKNFIERFKNKVTNDMLFKIPVNRTIDVLDYTMSVQEVMMGAIKTFGLSEQTQQLAVASFHVVHTVSEKIPELSRVFEWATFVEHEYTYSHSLLIALLATEVARGLPLAHPKASELLSMAACFHDMELENHQIRNEARFIKAIHLNTTMNRRDISDVKAHPQKALEQLDTWPTCPLELKKIILDHHERPDGSGFPQGKNWEQIDELSACFIICEDLAQNYLELKDRAAVEKYFQSQGHYYRQGIFKAIHHYLSEKLSPLQRPNKVAG